MTVTTDTTVTVTTDTWTLVSSTVAPAAGPRVLVDGLVAMWRTDILPPQAQPSTLQFLLYDDGTGPGGWLPLDIGQPISVYVTADAAVYRPVTFQGRVADLSAVNHPAGGVVFTVICADPLADLTATLAPVLITASYIFKLLPILNLRAAYQQLMDDAEITVDYDTGQTTPLPDLPTYRDAALANVTTFDALTKYVAHDIRGANLSRYLSYAVDPAVPAPTAGRAPFKLVEWDPNSANALAGVLLLAYSTGFWRLSVNPNYYAGHTGMVLTAANLAFDVGEWRKTRQAAINTVDLTGLFERPNGTTLQTVRREFPSDVAAYGRNSRAVESPLWYRDDARIQGDVWLGDISRVQRDYGIASCTIAWETLSAAQKAAWGSGLWPRPDQKVLGRPVAITGIPNDWRLIDGPVVFARLMGVTVTLSGGKIRLACQLRAVATITTAGITYDGIGALAPTVTYNNIDPTITYEQLTLV